MNAIEQLHSTHWASASVLEGETETNAAAAKRTRKIIENEVKRAG